MTTIGILGGSFDPVHNGHVIVATTAAEALGLDRVLVVPAHQSPHKKKAPAAPPAARLAMLEIAFAEVPRMTVSDLEILRPPPSFTIDTLRELVRRHPSSRLVLMLGIDAVIDLPRWRDAAAVVKACQVAVFRRTGTDVAALDGVRAALPALDASIVDVPSIEISATAVRARVEAGLPLAGFVPDGVRAEIARLRLYTR